MNYSKYLLFHGRIPTYFKFFYRDIKMTWRSVGSNNKQLVTQLKGKRFINYQSYINHASVNVYFFVQNMEQLYQNR